MMRSRSTLIPGNAEQQGLLRVSDESWNPIPLNYNSFETPPKQILVVHLLAKIVSFRVEHVLDMNYHGRELCIQVSDHGSLLEVKRAAHTALHLKANQTIDFQDRWGNSIQPTWSSFPHRPHGWTRQVQPMRLCVVSGTLPTIPTVSFNFSVNFYFIVSQSLT